MKNHLLTCVALATMLGCGGDSGGSGVDADKRVIDMTPSELDKFCAYVVEVSGPAHTVECDNGSSYEFRPPSKADCIADAPSTSATPNCAATVSQAEACFEGASSINYCDETLELPPECAALGTADCSVPEA